MKIILAFVVSFLVALLVFVGGLVYVHAQALAAPPPVIPALDAQSKAKLDSVQRAALFANSSCQALEAVKVYNDMRALVQADVERVYPGLTVNWATSPFALMAKAATK